MLNRLAAPIRRLALAAACLLLALPAQSQELDCRVKVIHTQVQGTNTNIFQTLETAITEFMNNRAWTDQQYLEQERISCTMNITIKKWDEAEGAFQCEMLFQVSRPVYNSSYSTIVFSMRDANFNFHYQEFDQLEFNINTMDNTLTALLAYYAYLFIGLDMDTFAPLGGTEVLQQVEQIVSNAQNMSELGWKAFDDNRNRHGIINDYMESSMETYRQLQYKYHREGLDLMADNADKGREAITEAIQMLKQARSDRPLSDLPIIFTDYKRDELVNIYRNHGTPAERQTVADILTDINASQSQQWQNITK